MRRKLAIAFVSAVVMAGAVVVSRNFDGRSDECLKKTWPPKRR